MESQWKHKIFTVNDRGFDSLALEIFRFQYANNPVYQQYVNTLRINVNEVTSVARIPFLPISLFKSHPIKTTAFEASVVFESSGTTATTKSRHFIKDVNL